MTRSRVWIGLVVLVAGGLSLAYAAGTGPGPATSGPALQQTDQHPGYPENREELEATTCRECHMEVTPDVYKDWSSSKHGVDNVRCFVCHGDFQTFKKSPGPETCRGCHAKQYDAIRLPEGKTAKTCWSCHPTHALSVHKTYKTRPSPLH